MSYLFRGKTEKAVHSILSIHPPDRDGNKVIITSWNTQKSGNERDAHRKRVEKRMMTLLTEIFSWAVVKDIANVFCLFFLVCHVIKVGLQVLIALQLFRCMRPSVCVIDSDCANPTPPAYRILICTQPHHQLTREAAIPFPWKKKKKNCGNSWFFLFLIYRLLWIRVKRWYQQNTFYCRARLLFLTAKWNLAYCTYLFRIFRTASCNMWRSK